MMIFRTPIAESNFEATAFMQEATTTKDRYSTEEAEVPPHHPDYGAAATTSTTSTDIIQRYQGVAGAPLSPKVLASRRHRCGSSSSCENKRSTPTTGCSPSPRSPTSPPSFAGGLIRLRLGRPLGIVFESQDSGRGVRICHLPEGGAAWRSRRLEVGDELLSIDDAGVARLGFDEIMDSIVSADPDGELDLLFRRPWVSSNSAGHKDRYEIG